MEALWEEGYCSIDYYWADEELRAVIDWLTSDYFAPKGSFDRIRHTLLDGGDAYLALADYKAYVEAQREVDKAYLNKARWARMAILNTARVGKFSSDRTIQEYADDIWKLPSVKV